MRRLLLFGVGLAVGAAVGVAAATLLTPASGGDLKQRVDDHIGDALKTARLAAEERRKALEAQLAAMTNPALRKQTTR
ncbi:MAG TPA: hypothetical protein PLD47_08735 [Aggregatilineales bacterium]|nr:YtxH domain-containing protein [Anaerolineales bacterium]HRE47798.1 hypothetical protein [Aggregatilineales bacterium]